MEKQTYGTMEILEALEVPFWRLEHLIRAGKITPLNRGRGIERRFSRAEFAKIKELLAEPTEIQRACSP